jgi:MinD-like ATPase involved in chromosome partitioning or flagellar assembly
MDAYAAVKLVCNDNPLRAAIVALTNCVTETAAAEEVHLRLDRAARRFLGCTIQSAGQVPFDPQVPRAAAEQHPLPLDSTTCAAAAAFERLSLELPNWFEAPPKPSLEVHYHQTSAAVGP